MWDLDSSTLLFMFTSLFFSQSSKGPIEVYLCPDEVVQSDPNSTTASNQDSACGNTSLSSGDDSFFSEDSTSCDSFRGKLEWDSLVEMCQKRCSYMRCHLVYTVIT